MTDADRIIAKFLRRLNIGNFLARMGEWLAVVLFLLGVVVLVVRLLSPSLWPEVLWLSLGVVPVGYLAWKYSRKQNFTRRESIALFDSKLQSGGLLMTMTECPDESWGDFLPHREEEWNSFLPRIRPMRFLKVVSVPLLFLVGVCLIPLQSHSGQGRELGTMQQKTTQKLQQLLDELNEAQLLDPEEAEKFQEEIQKLKDQNTYSAMTHERWETADTIEARLHQQAEQSVRTLQQARRALEKLKKEHQQNERGSQQKGKTSSQKKSPGAKKQVKNSKSGPNKKTGSNTENGNPQKALSEKPNNGQKLTEEQRRQLMENVSRALKTMLQNNSEMLSKLSPEMLERIKQMMKQQNRLEFPENAELRKQLMEELQNLMQCESQRLQEMMQKLQESGQLKELQKILGQCQNPGQRQGDGENPSSQSNQNQPGQKGINRGPGTSPIKGTHQPSNEKIGFRDVILPPGFHDRTKKYTFRIEIKEPEVETGQKTIRGNRKFEDGSSDLESFKRRIRPKHRRTVRKYFESKKKK